MLQEKKENIQPIDRCSHRSTSICKEILKNIIDSNNHTDKVKSTRKSNNRNSDENIGVNNLIKNSDRIIKIEEIKCLKLEESIKFLKKKIDSQDQQIYSLTEALKKQRKKNEQIEEEKKKINQIKEDLQILKKCVLQLKQENKALKIAKQSLIEKYEDKIKIFKNFLNQKEVSLEEVQNKIDRQISNQRNITYLFQEITSLQQKYASSKLKQSKTDKQLQRFTKIITQLFQELQFYKNQTEISKQNKEKPQKEKKQLRAQLIGEQQKKEKGLSVSCEQIRILSKNTMENNLRGKIQTKTIKSSKKEQKTISVETLTSANK